MRCGGLFETTRMHLLWIALDRSTSPRKNGMIHLTRRFLAQTHHLLAPSYSHTVRRSSHLVSSFRYAEMPCDDRVWYPPFLSGTLKGSFLTGQFLFDGEVQIRQWLHQERL